MIDSITAIKKIKSIDFSTKLDYEKLVKELGLYLDTNNIRSMPKSWLPFIKNWQKYCNYGLHSWQEPTQFANLLYFLSDYLSNNKINSYLEIGVKHGGTFIWLDSMIRFFNNELVSYAIDINPYGNIFLEYSKITNNINFIRADSTDPNLWYNLPNTIDIILIDGNHNYDYVLSDYQNALYKKPKILLFHDINNQLCPGVVKLWQNIIQNKIKNIDYYEFITDNCYYFGLGVYILKWE